MASYSDFNLREIRYLDNSTTYTPATTGFVAANDAAWDAGTKLRVFDMDFSELKYASIKDMSMQTQFGGRNPPIPTLDGGQEQMMLKFKMHLPGGSSTTSPETVATLMGLCMGGIKSPTLITDVAEAACTITQLKLDTHGQEVGQACIVGVKGDGYADGKVGVMLTKTDANEYALAMALPGIPQVGDAVKNGHDLWVDPTAESYQSFMLPGAYAGSGAADNSNCINIIGCSGTLAFGGFAAAEKPWVEFSFLVGQWRNEPYATTGAFTPAVSPSGDDPAGDRGIGSLTIGDAGTTTRVAVQAGDIEFDLGMALVPIIDPNGVNGIGGWIKVPSENGPMLSCTAYWGDQPGRRADFTAGTQKQAMLVLGHVAEATVAFELPLATVQEDPTEIDFNGKSGQRLVLAGVALAASEATADLRLAAADARIHIL